MSGFGEKFFFATKQTTSCTVSPLKMTLLGTEFDVISFNDVICKTDRRCSW